MSRFRQRSRRIGRFATAMVVVALGAAQPCLAGDHQPAPRTSRSVTTLSAASVALLQTSSQTGTPPAATGRAFFKSKKGATVLVLIAAGFGYTLYSRFQDEIKSPIREQ